MIVLPAHIARLQTLADGSWRVVADLGELDGQKIAEVGKLANKVVCLAITLSEDFTSEEKEVLKELGDKAKETGKQSVWDKY